jgi:hypothetical protein
LSPSRLAGSTGPFGIDVLLKAWDIAAFYEGVRSEFLLERLRPLRLKREGEDLCELANNT